MQTEIMEIEARIKQLFQYYMSDQCTVQELKEFFLLIGYEITSEEIKLLLGKTLI